MVFEVLRELGTRLNPHRAITVKALNVGDPYRWITRYYEEEKPRYVKYGRELIVQAADPAQYDTIQSDLQHQSPTAQWRLFEIINMSLDLATAGVHEYQKNVDTAGRMVGDLLISYGMVKEGESEEEMRVRREAFFGDKVMLKYRLNQDLLVPVMTAAYSQIFDKTINDSGTDNRIDEGGIEFLTRFATYQFDRDTGSLERFLSFYQQPGSDRSASTSYQQTFCRGCTNYLVEVLREKQKRIAQSGRIFTGQPAAA